MDLREEDTPVNANTCTDAFTSAADEICRVLSESQFSCSIQTNSAYLHVLKKHKLVRLKRNKPLKLRSGFRLGIVLLHCTLFPFGWRAWTECCLLSVTQYSRLFTIFTAQRDADVSWIYHFALRAVICWSKTCKCEIAFYCVCSVNTGTSERFLL